MTRPWSVSAAIVVLVVSPLLFTNATISKNEERDLFSLLKFSSQPIIVESVTERSNHRLPPKNVHVKDISIEILNLHELENFHVKNEIIKLKANRKISVFQKESSTKISDLPFSQNLHIEASRKYKFNKSIESHEAKKHVPKKLFLYNSKLSSRNATLKDVSDVKDLNLTDRLTIKNPTDSKTGKIHYAYLKRAPNIQRRTKRSVITLSDGETVQTVNCANRSTINNSCKNYSNFISVHASENINRNISNRQLNNSFSNRNLKTVKDFSSLPLSRLAFSVPRKKFVDITESGMGYRTPSTSEPSHKRHSPVRAGNDTNSDQNKSLNLSYMAPSVKPPGRLSAVTSAPENLDAASITGITLGSVVFLGVVGAMCFILYKRRNQNKPQTLSDKSSNPDSSVYIEESSDDSEEMYSLDNDSFLNSLEAMTIQNYWTENVKHTKL